MTTKAASDIINQSVNMGGLVQARSAISENGRIILSADSGVTIDREAVIDATGNDETGGGAISISASNLSLGGTIDASATQNDGGSISLAIDGRASLSGRIDASSEAGAGGTIAITAGAITESSSSTLDASGGAIRRQHFSYR